MGGSRTQTTTNTTGIPEEARPFLFGSQGILPRAQTLSRRNLDLPDYQVAGLTSAQNQAIQLGRSGVGAFAPTLMQGVSAADQGVSGMMQGQDMIGGAVGGAMPYRGMATSATQNAMAAYDPNSYQPYMNPYMDEVHDRTMQDIARQGTIQGQGIDAMAANRNAFGGARHGIMETEHMRNVLDTMADTSANLRMQGYNQAQGMSQQMFSDQMQRSMAGGAQLGNIGTAYGQLGLQGAQTMGQLGQGIGALASTYGDLAQAGQGMQTQDLNALMTVGAMQQGQQQAVLDARRQNAYQNVMSPYQQLGFFSDIYQGMPIGSITQTSQPGPSMLSQVGGLAMGIGSLSQAGMFGGS